MRDDAARAGRTPEAPFGASPHPRLPVFQAPDGGWYVDRDGLTATTERRWRQAFEPRTIRRRARLASLAGLLRAVLLLVGCAALGAGVDIVVGGSSDAVVVGAAIGALVGVWVALLTMLGTQPDSAPGPVVRVPEEVLLTPVTGPSPRRGWLWSTALDAEARARETIGTRSRWSAPRSWRAPRGREHATPRPIAPTSRRRPTSGCRCERRPSRSSPSPLRVVGKRPSTVAHPRRAPSDPWWAGQAPFIRSGRVPSDAHGLVRERSPSADDGHLRTRATAEPARSCAIQRDVALSPHDVLPSCWPTPRLLPCRSVGLVFRP
jgi:hypothetical protein